LDQGNDNKLENNEIKNNRDHGIYIKNANNNTLNNNTVCDNTDNNGADLDIYVSSSTGNSGDNNTCSWRSGWHDDSNPNGCKNICNETKECNSCTHCTNTIKNLDSRVTVKLTQNISTGGGYDCIVWDNHNITFDCQNHKITYSTAGSSAGIKMVGESYDHNTIKNCKIENFGTGIYLRYGDNNTFKNNEIRSNHNYGIHILDQGNDNKLENNEIKNNRDHGIYINNADDNTLNNNTVCDNTDNNGADIDIYVQSGSGNSGDNNTCSWRSGWNDDSNPNGCKNICECFSNEGCLVDQSCNLAMSICENLDCFTSFNHTCLNFTENETDLDAPITISNLTETYSENSTFVENITVSNAAINTSVTGDLNGIINFINYEVITIDTGSFAGKGFSKGEWNATLENINYSGELKAFSFFKPSERRIYIKGAISGDITGIVEGYLNETVNGSGEYNNFYATWRFNHLKNQIFSGELNLNGTVNYKNITNSTAEIYVLQTSIEGTTLGHYASAIETSITHVRMVNGSYAGEGFSVISYVSDSGSGDGWTYDKLSQDEIKMRGMFTDPLLGIVSGTLYENKTPRELLLRIDRIDIGLPPRADLKVKIWGPKSASPGQRINYIIEYRNDGTKIAKNVTIVLTLPYEVKYVSNTGEGNYISEAHEVIWHIENIPPQTPEFLTTTCRLAWGLQPGTIIEPVVTIDEDEEVQIDPNINITYEFSEITNKSVNMALNISNGSESAVLYYEFNVTTVGEAIEPIFNYTEEGNYIIGTLNFTTEGGSLKKIIDEVEVAKNEVDTVIDLVKRAEKTHDAYNTNRVQINTLDCLRSQNMISDICHSSLSGASNLMGCLKVGFIFIDKLPIPAMGEWYSEAGGSAMAELDKIFVDAGLKKCIAAHNTMNAAATGTPGTFKKLIYGALEKCAKNEVGSGSVKNVGSVSSHNLNVVVARDPNIKYGHEGFVLPGQKLNYTVEFENEGEGIAFGVYFTDTLDEDLNDSTLEMGQVRAISNDITKNGTVIGNGTYNSLTRTITWRIWGGDYSEVKSKEGGYAHFNVSINSNATSGTEIINYATVYFPSVPEVTLTNGIVSIVAEYNIEGNGVCNCSNCMICTAALEDNTNCYDKIKLTADITNQPGICINDPKNFNNKIFDCQGNEINGNRGNYGIYLNNKTNNTIKNCIITNFHKGVSLYNSSNNTITNNTVNSNWRGISLYNSPNNNVAKNIVNSNNDIGICLSPSNNNTLTNNTVNSNAYGIYLHYSSNNNTITNNTVNSNNKSGIYLYDNSNFNEILNNEISNNSHGISISDCDPWGDWCPGGNTNNTIERNAISNHNIGIYSENSTSVINSNMVINNTAYDLYSSDWLLSSGSNNTCDKAEKWDDTDATSGGCRNKYQSQSTEKATDIFDAVEMLEYLSGQKNLTQLSNHNKPGYYKFVGGNDNKDINLPDVFALIAHIVREG